METNYHRIDKASILGQPNNRKECYKTIDNFILALANIEWVEIFLKAHCRGADWINKTIKKKELGQIQ